MTCEFKNGKYVFCKEGTYFALTEMQVYELLSLILRLIEEKIK